MRRIPFILLALVSLYTCAWGQTPQHRHRADAPGAQHRPKSLQSLSERLIGEANYDYDGAAYSLTDTFFFTYSGSRYYYTCDYVYADYYFDNSGELLYNSATNSYQNYLHYAQTFDANNNLLTTIMQNWSAASASYVDTLQYVYTYTADNNISTSLIQLWDNISGSWQNTEKNLYTFDANNNLTDYITQKWDAHTSAWRNYQQQLVTFNSANKFSLEVNQDWDTLASAWVNQQEYLPTYDANNNQTVQLNLSWNSTASVWDTSSVDFYTFNANNQFTTDVYKDWNATTHIWVNEDSIIYRYDASGRDTAYIYIYWVSGAWLNNEQYLVTYDANGNETSNISQLWDATHSLWVNQTRYRYTYDGLNSCTMSISDSWNAGGFWEPVSSDQQIFYYYQDYTTSGIAPIAPAGSALTVYPSPATDILTIDLTWAEAQPTTMTIHDASGRLCRQWQAPGGASYQATIPISQLPAGSYIITAQAQSGQISRSFTVAR
jgi:hypothetical protein